MSPAFLWGIFDYIRPPNFSHPMPQHLFKSKVKNGDKVSVSFNGETTFQIGWIGCVRFYEGKTKYDIVDHLPDGTEIPLMDNVDSNHVKEIVEPRAGL